MRLSEATIEDCKKKFGDIYESFEHYMKTNRKKVYNKMLSLVICGRRIIPTICIR